MVLQKKIINLIKNGGVGVMPTDTIYGVVGSALNKKAVERIYVLRRRSKTKPMIILIGSLAQLKLFGIVLPDTKLRILRRLWGGRGRPVSVVLPLATKTTNHYSPTIKLNYLHRGTKTLAFRFPGPRWLRNLLLKTGPLVAPSTNPEGKPPATTIREAKKYFADRADFYLDGGTIVGRPSMVVELKKEKQGKIFRK